MLAREARQLGLNCHVLTEDPSDPAAGLATSVVLGGPNDGDAVRALARRGGAITFEHEWLSLDPYQQLEREGICFLPSLAALTPLLGKRRQRQLLNELHLPTPRWAPMEAALPPPPRLAADEDGDPYRTAANAPSPGAGDPPSALEQPEPRGPSLPEGLVFPVMAKASHGGYDGKGTRVLADQAALERHLAHHHPEEWLLEELVAFEMELAQVVSRDRQGQVRCFPLVQTHQRDHVCDWVLYPAPVSHAVEAYARNVVMSLVTALNYVGVMAIEFFFGPQGLLVNEVAPRVHNSGHLTLEACRTSQFAQQARIVAGLPMGSTDPLVKGALMVNLLGYAPTESAEAQSDYRDARAALQALEGACLHWYGKRPRPGRKLGHVTLLLEAEGTAQRESESLSRLEAVRRLWPWTAPSRPTDESAAALS
jgi:5-(carboxyamino)imidazole ribonucleotide synthase